MSNPDFSRHTKPHMHRHTCTSTQAQSTACCTPTYVQKNLDPSSTPPTSRLLYQQLQLLSRLSRFPLLRIGIEIQLSQLTTELGNHTRQDHLQMKGECQSAESQEGSRWHNGGGESNHSCLDVSVLPFCEVCPVLPYSFVF